MNPGVNLAEARGRVLVIARDFPPSRLMGAQACGQIARYFPIHGWEPIVLTLREADIENPDPDDRRPFPGVIVGTGMLLHPLRFYRKLKAKLVQNGRGGESGNRPRRQPGPIRRWILSLLHAPDVYTGWIPPAAVAGLRAIRRWRITHIFSSGPFWTNHIVGLILADLTGLAWTVHFRDPWTQVPSPSKPVSALSMKFEKWLERLILKRANFVVCVTERHTTLLRRTFPTLPPEKFVTIPNGYDEAEWEAQQGDPDGLHLSPAGQFVITYAGSFALGTRSPRPLFSALCRLIQEGDVGREDIRVDLFGDCNVAEGAPVLDMVAEYELDGCVHVGPSLSRRDIVRQIRESNLLLLLQEAWPLQIPGKTYEYLRAGRPILALTWEGALADLLQQIGGAWVVSPRDQDAICAAVREAYEAWKTGKKGPIADRTAVGAFDRRVLSGQIAALFDAAATSSPAVLGSSPEVDCP